jgi:hypothetical protein
MGAERMATGLVKCDLAVLKPSGGYRTRAVIIKLPAIIHEPHAGTKKAGYRGWAEGVPDPVRLAVCEIPATVVGDEWFRTLFSGGRTTGGSRTATLPNSAKPAATTAGASTTEMMTVYDVEVAQVCAPQYAIEEVVDWGCECGPDCEGWDDDRGEGEWEGPPPADLDDPDASLIVEPDASAELSSGELAYMVPITCYGQTDNPHRSGTTGYYHNANVHGRTVCSAPIQMSVNVMLQKQKCYWAFCWWSSVGTPGLKSGVSVKLESNSPALCSTGWWRGRSHHAMTFPPGYWPASGSYYTYRSNYITC